MDNVFSFYPSINDDLQRLFSRIPDNLSAQHPQLTQEAETDFQQNGIEKEFSPDMELPNTLGSWGGISPMSLMNNYPLQSSNLPFPYGSLGTTSRAGFSTSPFGVSPLGTSFMRRSLTGPGSSNGNGNGNNQRRPKRKTFSECVFCRNNGEPTTWYRSHSLRDGTGRVTCPVLRAYTCPICGTSGDTAHTIKYCPRNGSTEIALKSMGIMSDMFSRRKPQ